MILFILYLISLVWMVVFLTNFVQPFKRKKRLENTKIKFIPLKKSTDPHTKYYVLDSGELVEMIK
jgi:glycopeptide antibiotics resistance protein